MDFFPGTGSKISCLQAHVYIKCQTDIYRKADMHGIIFLLEKYRKNKDIFKSFTQKTNVSPSKQLFRKKMQK